MKKNIRKSKKVKKNKRVHKANKTYKKLAKKVLEKFKKILLERKEQIAEEINHISLDTLKQSQKDASGDISGYTYHMADVATDNFDREFSLGLAGNEREVLYEIDLALERIKDGSFGFCEVCQKPISKIRLKAVPYAKLCIKCKESEERM